MRWLGVDGGGTKTAFSAYDEGMRRLCRHELGTCHVGQVGYGGMAERLREGIALCEADGVLGGDWGLGLGLAGYGSQAEVRRGMEAVVAEVAAGHPAELVNDARSALAAALDLADGIVVVAGTGSIAYGIRGERTLRCGGWGYQIGDEGSGWWLGKRLLAAFSKQSDGRRSRGPLHDVVMRELSLAIESDLVTYVRNIIHDGRTEVASLGRLVSVAARRGDADARAILEDAACEEAEMVGVVARGLFDDVLAAGGEVPVSYVGGTFRAGDVVLGPLAGALPRGCVLRAPAYEPDLGACLLLRRRLRREGVPC